MYKLKVITILLACFCGVAAFAAVPQQVAALAEQMLEDGSGTRAGYNKNLGVYVVAVGTAEITGSKAKAKTVARMTALKNIGEYLGSQVTASETAGVKSVDVNGVKQEEEFFSSMMQVNVKQALKGVQDYKMVDDGDKMIAVVYLTTKSTDKSAELKAAMDAMGDEGTVRAVGEANTHQNAIQMALRAAVEQVVGTMVVGETKITDNEAVRNKIFSGAEGFVDTYRVTEEIEVSPGWRITVIAKVSKKKLLDSYRVYLKALGDPVFYLECTSSDSDQEDKQIAARFGQLFRKLGFKISKTPEGANFCINASGEYRRVKNPMDEDQIFTQYSMIIKVLSKTGEELLSLPNNPRKSAVCINNPERERELCAAKAFKQMEKPVHEAINAMIARMMADYTDKLMNSDN
jgi:hypothetical protein